MGNCISYCMTEPSEYKETERIVIHKKSKLITKNYKQLTMSYYDSCVL